MVTTEAQATGQFGAPPHGGKLIDRFATGSDAEELRRTAGSLYVREINERELSDVEMLAIGGYSPLAGFMSQADYESVVERMHLANGLPWTIPITFALTDDDRSRVHAGDRIALAFEGRRFAVVDVEEVFHRDRKNEAEKVYRTTEEAHPGVAALYAASDTLAGGPITLFDRLPELPFPQYRLPPSETRKRFQDRGWRTIVGFQTRNPIHRAHEYLQKCALETVDGLLLQPLVGATKSDDVPADVRMRTYEVLLQDFYPEDRVLLAVNPAAMRYGGPREAIFHALIRKNFGCTHFIVGRDHAGVGSYYGPYDAQHIFSEFEAGSLGIQPMFFENSFFCNVCGNYATKKTCPHGEEDHLSLSGTQVRSMLRNGELPPPQFTRPPVARILVEAMKGQA